MHRTKIKNASPLVRELMEIVVHHHPTFAPIATRSGVARRTLYGWCDGSKVPLICNVEAVAEAMGYRIKLERIGE